MTARASDLCHGASAPGSSSLILFPLDEECVLVEKTLAVGAYPILLAVPNVRAKLNPVQSEIRAGAIAESALR